MTRRTERIGDLLLETLSELLLRDVKDPRIGLVTLTGVQVDDDLRRVRVRWTLLGGQGQREGAQRGLESAARFMQGKAARLLRMKFTPELHFEYDEGFDHADQIGRLLRDLKKE
ncbi:MAG: 30S ribosome-binding factor RbfA [Candidatus Binatia bacterium]